MTTRPRTSVPSATTQKTLGNGPAIDTLDYSWTLSLRAANRSDETIRAYRAALQFFSDYLRDEQMPQAVDSISREHVERFIVWLQDVGYSPATVATRWRGLRRFFNWCLEEGEIARSPMERMRQPSEPEMPRKVIAEADLRALLAACEGKDFYSRRNMALIRVLIDTGMRRGELVGMRLGDIDWPTARLLIRGKGDRSRWVHVGRKALRALDSYKRVRLLHPHSDLDALWLSRDGALTYGSMQELINRLAHQAGIEHIHPHLFRHTFADSWLANEGNEGDLMELGGWRSQTVMYRYGRARRAERALAAHARLSPGDRL